MARKNTDTEAVPAPSKSNRLSLPLKEDGTFDVAEFRPSTKEKFLHAVLNNPEVVRLLDPDGAKAVGLDEPTEAPDLFGGITLENIRTGLDMLSSVNARVFAMVGGKLVKHPLLKDDKGQPVPMSFNPDLVAKCFALTPEQHGELDPRALRLAQKYSGAMPEWFKKHLDIYMLVTMFLKYQGENAIKAITLQAQADVAQIRKAQMTAQPSPGKSNGHAATMDSPAGPIPIRITEVPPNEGATA